MAAPTLSVIIVTYNSAAEVGACLGSIFEHPPACEFEIIVVDNGSHDATVSLLRNWQPRITLIEAPENPGFAGGNCIGARQATGEFLLLLNPDTVVRLGALDTLIAALREDDERWVAGACLLTPAGEPASAWGDFPTVGWAIAELAPWRRMGLRVRSSRQLGRTCEGITAQKRVDWVSGAAFLVRRSAWEELGGLYTGYFLYFEETDFCFRVHGHGGEVILVPAAQIVHAEGTSVGQLSVRQRVWFADSLFRFMWRNRGAAAAIFVRVWIGLVNLVLLAVASIAAPFSATARREWPRYGALVRAASGLYFGHPGRW